VGSASDGARSGKRIEALETATMFSPPRKSYTALLSELIGARSIQMALRGASVIRPQSAASFQSTSLESAPRFQRKPGPRRLHRNQLYCSNEEQAKCSEP
jgi:hypothetical protein